MFVYIQNLSGKMRNKLVIVINSEWRRAGCGRNPASQHLLSFCGGSLPDPPHLLPGALCPGGSPVGSTPAGKWRGQDCAVTFCCPESLCGMLPEAGWVPWLVTPQLCSPGSGTPALRPQMGGGEWFSTALPVPGPPPLYKTPSNYSVQEHCFLLGSTH